MLNDKSVYFAVCVFVLALNIPVLTHAESPDCTDLKQQLGHARSGIENLTYLEGRIYYEMLDTDRAESQARQTLKDHKCYTLEKQDTPFCKSIASHIESLKVNIDKQRTEYKDTKIKRQSLQRNIIDLEAKLAKCDSDGLPVKNPDNKKDKINDAELDTLGELYLQLANQAQGIFNIFKKTFKKTPSSEDAAKRQALVKQLKKVQAQMQRVLKEFVAKGGDTKALLGLLDN